MSIFEVKMPKLGESITEGTIMSWSVKVGDVVKEDDILFEVTTAKVNAEVPSPVEGVIQEILFQEGETAEVGLVVARINLDGDAVVAPIDQAATPVAEISTAVDEAKPAVDAKSSTSSMPDVDVLEKVKPLSNSNASKQGDSLWYSPVVLQLAKEANLETADLERIPGTGYLGRLSKKDLQHYLQQVKDGRKPEANTKRLIPAPPKLASIISNSFGQTESNAPTNLDNLNRVDMDPIARIIAQRMVDSKKISAHVTTVVEVDVTKLVLWRNRTKDRFQQSEGIGLNYLPAIVQSTAKALKLFPKVNASVDGTQFILKKQINIGIAVALPDDNLIVPVVREADKLSLSGIAHSIDSLATKARSNKLKMEEIEGGTFTITNFGTFKNLFGTPIINQPEVAILGVGYIEKKPAVLETPQGDVIAIRHKMYLSLTYDHRIINGAMGGAFLKQIADYLENWEES